MNASYLDNYKNVIRGDSTISSSLFDFANEAIKKYRPQSILELGCDRGDLLSVLEAPIKVGLDISFNSILEAQKRFPHLLFRAQNVLTPWSEKSDLILDSHLFHCLVFPDERALYLKHMKDSLNPGGKIIIECMGEVPQKSFKHYLFNECGQFLAETREPRAQGTLAMNGRNYLPFRISFGPLIETEIQAAGLSILSLFYSPLEFEFTIMGEKLVAPVVRLVLG